MLEKVVDMTLNLVKGIVDYPSDVQIRAEEEDDDKGTITLLLIKVHPDDVGLMLGTQGETARALRKVVSLFGYRALEKRVYVKIVTPKMHEQYSKF